MHKLALLSAVNDHREGGSFAMIVGQLARRVIDSLCVTLYGNISKSNKNTIQIDDGSELGEYRIRYGV